MNKVHGFLFGRLLTGVLVPLLSVGDIKSIGLLRLADADGAGEATRERGSGLAAADDSDPEFSAISTVLINPTPAPSFSSRSRSFSFLNDFFFAYLSSSARSSGVAELIRTSLMDAAESATREPFVRLLEALPISA